MRVDLARIVAACLLGAMSAVARAAGVPSEVEQLVLVVTHDWDANRGKLYAFERAGARWAPRAREVDVTIGRAGAAWGIGVHEPQEGPQKVEGDGRSPAGIFSIGTAFGYAAKESAGIAYRAMSEADYCIDVGDSPHYNRIVDARVVGREAVEKSTEPMRRDIHAGGDRRYALGFVIEHNPQNVRAKGSCIFAHLWGGPDQTTAGCTAMSEAAMRTLLGWLDGNKRPMFVLLPYPEYRRLQTAWGLPEEVAAPK